MAPTRAPRRTYGTALAVAAFWAALATNVTAQPSDRAALEALYDATGGANWTDSTNWKTSAPLGEWHGVTTDAAGRVTGLYLDRNGLTGPIPGELGRLENLRFLILSINDLTGPIPGELGLLENLQSLILPNNDLTGSIPAKLGNLTNLEALDLQWNALAGPIPGELGLLENLQFLILSNNELTGPIPGELGLLENLQSLILSNNELTGPIPAELGSLANLETLYLNSNELTGSIPAELGRLANLQRLDLSHNWGLSGPLPSGLDELRLDDLYILVTRICAPAAWEKWLATLEFSGPLCEAEADAVIDVAVVYTPAAREAEGGTAAIEARIDLVIATANEAYAASGIDHRLALVGRSEVPYVETGDGFTDVDRLGEPEDGHMDEAHALRDRTGADLVSLMVAESNVTGIADLAGPFSLTVRGWAFTHELGHNMGLLHDRYQVQHHEGGARSHPAYGYVNQQAFEAGASRDAGWVTIMAYGTQCIDAGIPCYGASRFSNPRQHYKGDRLGVPYGAGQRGVTGPADAVAVLNVTGPAVAAWRDRPGGANRPPRSVGALPDLSLVAGAARNVDLSPAFTDPDGDALLYTASSSDPQVVTVRASGDGVTLTAVAEGAATVRVTATDGGGLSVSHLFAVTVSSPPNRPPAMFTDDQLRPGVTPVRVVHFTELRERINALREANGLGRFGWTDPALRAGATGIRLVHLRELRLALANAYTAAGRPVPRWTDPAPTAGTTRIRAVHLTELRAAVVALE